MRAVLFIHGLSAKKEDNEYFINKMKKMPNIDMYSFVLPGHEDDKVSKAKYKDWIKKSEMELKKILEVYRKVTIVAHSMGCIIATNLASHYKQVEKLVLISPAFIFGNFEQNKEDLKKIINKEVDMDLGTGFEGSLTKFKEVPISVWSEYRRMAKKNIKNIPKVKCPTLIIYGTSDNLISKKSVMYVYDHLKCKKDIIMVDRVRHQVFKSNKKGIITDYIYRFITFNMLYQFSKRKVM